MASPARVVISDTPVASDFEIEKWVAEQYGFVPHPFWIKHCKELYLHRPQPADENRRSWHDCPLDKRSAIKAAFLNFGMLQQ